MTRRTAGGSGRAFLAPDDDDADDPLCDALIDAAWDHLPSLPLCASRCCALRAAHAACATGRDRGTAEADTAGDQDDADDTHITTARARASAQRTDAENALGECAADGAVQIAHKQQDSHGLERVHQSRLGG